MAGDKDKIILEVDEQSIDEDGLKKTKRVLVFSLGDENYGVEIDQTKEVIRPSDITKVPNTPEFVIGVMNLRGEIISIIDIRYFFGIAQKEKNKDVRIIVTDVTGEPIGIIVDKVEDTIDIQEDKIQPPLATLKGNVAAYTRGQVDINKKILILLDLEKIVNTDEINNLRTEKEQE